jgi:hypothetical protein
MNSQQTHFFAMRDDQIALLGAVETRAWLKYVVSGLLPSREPKICYVGADIPTLGVARHESAIHGDSYLVMGRSEEIYVREVKQQQGGVLYSISQERNPNTIIFLHGGVIENVLLYGKAGTIWKTEASLKLYRLFCDVLRQNFSKVGPFYVGKSAYEFMKAGGRLTQAVQSPSEYNLVPP